MTKLTNKGFERTRLIERTAEMQAKARAIFGQDIDLSSDTMDGQHLNLFAESISDIDELAELVWQSFDPDSASGASLSRLVKLNGIERSQGSYSIALLTLTGTANTLIPKGSIISDKINSIKFYTTDDVRIGSNGTATVNAAPDTTGAIQASAKTLTAIRTPIWGWSTVTNLQPVISGKPRETDQQLRLRRRGSASKGNRNMIESLWSSLSDLDGVIQAVVLENPTNTTDNKGLPPNSIHAVVLGGDSAQIAHTIWISKTGGTVLDGKQTVVINDIMGGTQNIKFSRPVVVPVKIKVNITQKIGWSHKTAVTIRDTLFEYINTRQRVGEGLVSSDLYSPLNEIGGFSINKVYLAKKNSSFAEQSLVVDFFESIVVDINDIEVVQS